MTAADIRLLKRNEINPEELKEFRAALDLFKDMQGNVYVKPKDGSGAGEPTGINLQDLE